MSTSNDGSCPGCGCPESEVVRTSTWGGAVYEVRRCDHCKREFTHHPEHGDDEPATSVTFHVLRCPCCRSEKVPVTRTMKPTRYHRCDNCGWTFKSVEE